MFGASRLEGKVANLCNASARMLSNHMRTRQTIVVAFVVGTAVAAVVMLRNQKPEATDADVNIQMPIFAEDAVQWGAEQNAPLDYTPESVERVEALLAKLHEERAAGRLPDDQLNKASLRYGAYVGEVIRRLHQGTWALDSKVAGSFPIRWRDHESFPVGWCAKRIVNGEEDNVWLKFRDLLLDDTDGKSADNNP
jgi:hypothetical protein